MLYLYTYLNALLNELVAEREEGQGLVEYALIIVLVAIVVIAALTLLGGQISAVFSRISSTLG
ncbi:MAG: Flp family type IVb pilin [Ardenticatenia bacterium]|nr:MAG: Flp family type IVb pilin [Ardenticatenia bacterium]